MASDEPVTPPPHGLAGHTLGACLKRGPTSVFEATDPRGERVVVKLAQGGHAGGLTSGQPGVGPQAARRVHAERAALARFDHPGIVRLRSQGEREGLPWFATDHLGALDLATWGQATRAAYHGSCPNPALLRVAQQLCEALAHAHEAGVVHRDLKPSNILMKGGRPVLIDFGLCGLSQGATLRAGLDLETTPVGTAQFMAPEQIAGAPPAPQADLYALGCLLHLLLTGAAPFGGADASAVMRAHLGAPRPALDPAVSSPGLEALLDALLHKRQDARPRGAKQVSAWLEALIADPLQQPHLAPPSRPTPAPPGTAALHGRDADLHALQRALSRQAQGPRWVLGESGVGKTRLLNEVGRSLARKGWRLLWSAAEAPLPGARAGALGASLSCLSVCLLGALGSRPPPPQLAQAQALIEGLSALCSAEPTPRVRLFEALCEVLDHLSARAPALLIIDDAQWADELTLAFVAWLGRGAAQPGRRWKLLCGARLDGEGLLLERIACANPSLCVRLGQLQPAPMRALVEHALHGAAMAQPALDALLTVAQGVPLLALEGARLYDQALRRGGDSHTWRPPSTPAALLAARQAQLSADAQRLLETAAVLGAPLDGDDLAALSCLSEGALHSATAELLTSGALQRGPACLGFSHARVREVAYDRLTPARRIALHQEAARRLSAHPKPLNAGRLAAHLDAAGQLAAATDAYVEAAEQAAHTGATGQAERAWRRALALSRGATRVQVALRLSREVLEVQGRLSEALELLRDALQQASALGAQLHAKAAQHLAWVLLLLGRYDEAEPLCLRAIALAEDAGDGALRCQAQNKLATLRADRGDLLGAICLLRQVIHQASTLGQGRTQAHAQGNLGVYLFCLGHMRPAMQAFDRGRALARAVGDRTSQGISTASLAYASYYLGDLHAATRWAEEALSVQEITGDEAAAAVSLSLLGLLRGETLDLQGGVRLLEAALKAHQRASNAFFEALSHIYLARLRRRSPGGWAPAETHATRGHELLKGMRLDAWVLLAEAELALCRAAAGADVYAATQAIDAAARAQGLGPDAPAQRALNALNRLAPCHAA